MVDRQPPHHLIHPFNFCLRYHQRTSFQTEWSSMKDITSVLVTEEADGALICNCSSYRQTGRNCRHMIAVRLFERNGPIHDYISAEFIFHVSYVTVDLSVHWQSTKLSMLSVDQRRKGTSHLLSRTPTVMVVNLSSLQTQRLQRNMTSF